MTSLPLVFDAPRTALPPRHLADLSPGRAPGRGGRARREAVPGRPAVPALLPAAGRTGPSSMTDLPAAGPGPARPGAAAAAADRGPARRDRPRDHPQDAVEAARRHPGRERADALPGPAHRLHLQPGRLRHGLPVLRHRPGRPAAATCPPPRSSSRRSRRPGWRRPASCPAARCGCRTWCSWAWASRWPTTSRVVGALHRLIDPAPAGLGLSQRSITMSTVGLVPAIAPAGRRGPERHPGGVAARARTTSCATPWCR